MPYTSSKELPESVTNVLPDHAQDIYKEAFNSAYQQYSDQKDREETAHKVAWSAVKKSYSKGNDGTWHKNE